MRHSAQMALSMTSGIVLSVVMLSVAIFHCYDECRYAQCSYAKCHCAECRGDQFYEVVLKKFLTIFFIILVVGVF
jgi:hypothetical protein